MSNSNSIEVRDGRIKLKLSVYVFRDAKHPDGDVYVAYCPALDLVGCGHGESAAKASFEWVMQDYINDMEDSGKLESDLLSHGWKKGRNGAMTEPTFPSMSRNPRLGEVLRMDSYTKYSVPVVV